jgi:hypothetical protein
MNLNHNKSLNTTQNSNKTNNSNSKNNTNNSQNQSILFLIILLLTKIYRHFTNQFTLIIF